MAEDGSLDPLILEKLHTVARCYGLALPYSSKPKCYHPLSEYLNETQPSEHQYIYTC